jgi:hypothetical protein
MMATQLSKADRIRKMLHLSNKDIAEIIGCHEAYVRVVRQRTSPSGNPVTNEAAKNWAASNHGRVLAAAARRFRERYHNDPGYRAKHIARNTARNKDRYRTDQEFRERSKAYRRARYYKNSAESRAS